MAARVFAWYGVTSAGLAAVAVHGTILMVVRRRRRDLAIRLALGAERALPVAAFVGLTVLGGAGLAGVLASRQIGRGVRGSSTMLLRLSRT